MSALYVPQVEPDADPLTAALAYARAGWFVGPVRRGDKHPAGVLGKGWPRLTSTDPEVIVSWFAGTDHGVMMHAGRSGAVVFDVDTPANLHPLIGRALDECAPPYQSTRADEPGRGHYLFTLPPGRMLGNSLGELAAGWGEVRGRNGLVVVAPSHHPAPGGRYSWERVGPVPELPAYLAERLPDALPSADAVATPAEVEAFLAAHTAAERPELVRVHVAGYVRAVEAGESRHHSMTGPLAGAMREAVAGLVDARTAAEALREVFLAAVAKPGTGPKQGPPRTGRAALVEWSGLLAWAVGQAHGADVAAVRARVGDKVPPDPFAGIAPPRDAPAPQIRRDISGGTNVPPVSTPSAEEDAPPPSQDEPDEDGPPDLATLLDIVTASDVDVRRVRYLWAHRVPLGACTLMPGEEGIGKTTVGVRIIADMTRGRLPGEFWGTPRDALIIAAEDGIADVMTPRLREAGADLDRVHFVRARIGLDGRPGEVIVPRDLASIGLAVRRWDVGLVWIDSLATTLPDELKSISYKDTAKVLRALGQWAEAERVAVVAPWHLNKAAGSDTAVRIMDSRAFRTAVRSMLLVVADPDAPEGVTRGIVALDKANAGTLHVPGLRYELRTAPYVVDEVDEDTGEVVEREASCAVADWIGEVEGDGRAVARDALAPKIEREGSPREWLREYLAGEGEAARSAVMAAAADDGYSPDQIKRAARGIGVHSHDETGRDEATGRPWRRAIWSLPPSRVAQSGDTRTTAPTAPTGEGYQRPTTPIYAGQAQSVQLVQSVDGAPDWGHAAPLGDEAAPLGDGSPSCASCGDLLSAERAAYGATVCASCYRAEAS